MCHAPGPVTECWGFYLEVRLYSRVRSTTRHNSYAVHAQYTIAAATPRIASTMPARRAMIGDPLETRPGVRRREVAPACDSVTRLARPRRPVAPRVDEVAVRRLRLDERRVPVPVASSSVRAHLEHPEVLAVRRVHPTPRLAARHPQRLVAVRPEHMADGLGRIRQSLPAQRLQHRSRACRRATYARSAPDAGEPANLGAARCQSGSFRWTGRPQLGAVLRVAPAVEANALVRGAAGLGAGPSRSLEVDRLRRRQSSIRSDCPGATPLRHRRSYPTYSYDECSCHQ